MGLLTATRWRRNAWWAALNRYLIPFFGNHHINRIDYPLLKQFEAWRIEKMGKQPKASSIGTHNSALNKVFDEAIERGFIRVDVVLVDLFALSSRQRRLHAFDGQFGDGFETAGDDGQFMLGLNCASK